MRSGSPARRRLTPALLVMAMVAALLPLGQAATAATNNALQFNGSTQYIRTATTTTSSTLQLTNFTIETWFRRSGTGVTINTGAAPAGLDLAIPLIAKGRGENDQDPGTADVNYFLGIDGPTNTIAADFEEARTTGNPSGNHALRGSTTIPANNVWHHAAATYDGAVFRVYLDGVLEDFENVATTPATASTVVTTFGTAFNSTATAGGFFAGAMDETRIWNTARSEAQIQASMNTEVAFPTTGLLGRWGMNEGSGTASTANSIGTNVGTMVATPTWVAGATPLNPATPGANASLFFNGLNQYADMGAASSLNTPTWTVETWFKQTNNGTEATSGTGNLGLTDVIPLISKGRAEAESDAADINYFLGLDVTDPANPRIAADFESRTASPAGLNFPLSGSTNVTQNVWHHAAATYDGSVLKVYLDGVGRRSTDDRFPCELAEHRPRHAGNVVRVCPGRQRILRWALGRGSDLEHRSHAGADPGFDEHADHHADLGPPCSLRPQRGNRYRGR